jgi:iron complex outermembrane receptor protein
VKISSNLLQKAQERDMRSIYLARISAISLAASSQAWAQSAPAQQSVDDGDEIIVIATKREQTLQDMPMSLVVTYDETVERTQIRDLIDLQSVVPSLKVAQFNAAAQPNFIIRGFGNWNGSFGIESSVGVFFSRPFWPKEKCNGYF